MIPTHLREIDLTKFAFEVFNRPIDEWRVRVIVKAITKKNLLHYFPVLVKKVRDKYIVMDGQHRVCAAKKLGCPIYFFIASDDVDFEDIPDVNSLQRPWKLTDYLDSFCRQGKREYIKLLSFKQSTGLGLSTCMNLCQESVSHDGTSNIDSFRQGNFKTGKMKEAYDVAKVALRCVPYIPFAKTRTFIIALSRAMQVPGFDPERFISKVEINQGEMEPCTKWRAYLSDIERVYNYKVQSRNLLSIVVEVQKGMRTA